MEQSGLQVFVPEKILLDDRLTGEEKFIIALIYDDVISSRDSIATILNKGDIKTRNMMKKLVQFNLVKTKKNGNKITGYEKVEPVRKIIKRRLTEKVGLLEEKDSYNNKNIISKISIGRKIELRSSSIKKENKFVPHTVQPFLDYWFAKGLFISSEDTKKFSKDIEALKRLLSGRLFLDKPVPYKYVRRSFTLDEWKLALDRFILAATDDRYHPVDKPDLTYYPIHRFLYHEKYKSSSFLRYLEIEPKVIKRVHDNYPHITARFIFLYSEYRKEVHNDYTWLPTKDDEITFARATRRTVEFFVELEKKLDDYHVVFSRKNSIPDFVWASVLWDIGNADFMIQPGVLCSNRTFERRLPDYLRYKRMLTK